MTLAARIGLFRNRAEAVRDPKEKEELLQLVRDMAEMYEAIGRAQWCADRIGMELSERLSRADRAKADAAR